MKKTIFKDLNRALIKRFELLPNVFEFTTEKYSIHEYAAIYGIEKILRRTYAMKLLVSKPNRYLERQYHRLTQYAANGQTVEFNHLSEIIIRKSVSFRILALNRTISDWHIKPIRELRRIWRSLSYISRTLSSELKYKRVWIDKKPGDYARPLGVPTPAWRCYSFMWMDHIERYFKASGKLASWQHGGRSGVGVLSCYKELIPRLKESKFIYEFDIKGFFDNISHEAIIQKFKENMYYKSPTTTWITQILKAKPTKYILPPIEADLAVKAIKVKQGEDKLLQSMGIPPVITKMTMQEIRDFPRLGMFKLKPGVFDPLDIFYRKPKVKDLYKTAMEGKPITVTTGMFGTVTIGPITEKDRALGRDSWKNLGQTGRGVPQGLNTSPFISTVMTDSAFYDLGLWKAILMYMDDGLLFAATRMDLNRNIQKLKDGLKRLGLEMEPSKSGLVKEDGKWLKSLKFLGLRYLPESDTLMSDTRSGTKVEFPTHGQWDDIKRMATLNGLSVPYMRKLFDKLINTQAYETGLKYGFLGCLIAGSQYKEAKTMVERKEEISRGQSQAWAQISNSKGFIWKHQDLLRCPETLTNVSSIASHRFAEFNARGYKLHIRRAGKVNRRQRI
jgi:hypothetical protein